MASANLLLRLGERDVDVALIQEPWIHGGKILGLNAINYKCYYINGAGNIRSCILAKKHLNIFILPDYSDADTVAVSWESDGNPIWFSSCYMPHDQVGPPPSKTVHNMMRAANSKGIPVVIGADANAHHDVWGSSDTNERGESILDFLLNQNLVVINKGSEPTFVVSNRQEVLDITVISAKYEHLINSWRVSNDVSASDHRYLEFCVDLNSKVDKPKPYINRKKTRWETHNQIVANHLAHPPSIQSTSDIEEAVNHLSCSFKEATSLTCNQSTQRGKAKPPWWNEEIAETRKQCRKLYNQARRTGNWLVYRTSLTKYRNQVRKSQRKSWRDFCSNVENSSETNRLRKVLSKQPSVPSYIQKSDGSWTNSCKESLEELTDTHFPGCQSVSSDGDTFSPQYSKSYVSIPISRDILLWAINSFSPFKSPGPDGIIPADLQKNTESVIPWLLPIYKSCLEWGYIPQSWTKSEVVFIPKGGKTSHTKAKDYRPISLSSFLLKTLERIVDTHIRISINSNLSRSQHAYTKGKSVETALHSLVGYIEKSFEYNNYTLTAFLDIEGAFNNVKPAAIINALGNLGLDDTTIKFVTNLLSHRMICSSMGNSQIHKTVNRGTPQGGVLSPLLWNIVINELLVKMESLGFKVVAYADDVAIAVSGFHLDTISQRMNIALRTVLEWSINSGLNVNPAKTELVLFTNKREIPSFTLPSIGGVQLTLSDTAKYLGIILDRKLSWTPNIKARAQKAMTSIYICKKAIGNKWGVSPKNVNWIYEAVIKPILYYGATVWWNSLSYTNCAILEKVHRSIGLLITGALRSTATKSLFAILNWLPVDLIAKKIAVNTALRLNLTNSWNQRTYGHSRVLNEPYDLPELIDYCTPSPSLTRCFNFIISENAVIHNQSLERPNLSIYTDGSKRDGKVGGGVYIEGFGIRMSFRLPDECSALQAEISAIKRAANWIRYYKILDHDIQLYTDSQAAIKALTDVFSASPLVLECRASLNKMARHSNITLIWVRGHGASSGNKLADELAKRGTTLSDSHIDYLCGVPLQACKTYLDRVFTDQAQNRWLLEEDCSTTRKIWPTLSPSRTSSLLRLTRTQVCNIVAVVTGHCKFGTHAKRMGLPYNDLCRSCNDEEELETVFHLLCQCPALSELRFRTFGSYTLISLTELSVVEIDSLKHFIAKCNWF